MFPTVEERLQLCRDFWDGKEQKHPLIIFRLGHIFFSKEFEALRPLLHMGTQITADQLHVKEFLPDYERMYQELEQVSMDGIFSADPCTGIPWMEAILGAQVEGTNVSFVSHPTFTEAQQLDGLTFSRENPWYQKYLEFCRELTSISAGRFPVGQPILRGVTDTIGSIMGQQNMVWGIIDEPDIMRKALDAVVDTQRSLIEDQYQVIQPFHGGYNMGFYHIWAPGKILWFQEDLAALLSPQHFDEFLCHTYNRYVEGYDYTAVHLHPTAFHHLNGIISVKGLSAVQITNDANISDIETLFPACRQVIEGGKRLMLGMGSFSKNDLDLILKKLPRHSLALNIIVDSVEDANELMAYIESHC